jgi:two-component system invasion response regulator UvrY
MIRVVVADDHPIVREGLRRVLDRQAGIEVVAEAERGDGLPGLVRSAHADVVVLDIAMPGPDFLELIPTLTSGEAPPRVLVLSGYPEEVYAVHALRVGASGYLEKANAPGLLVDAVRRVHGGGRFISASLADLLARQLAGEPPAADHHRLSAREMEVLRLIGSGLSLKEIGVRLGVNAKTVSTYRARILGKLRLRTNADLVRYALEHRLVLGSLTTEALP